MMLLGELHVAGKIRWGAYEEAEYVWKMNNVYKKTYDELASHLRWSRSKLSQKITAYKGNKKLLRRNGRSEGQRRRFSFFEEFLKRKELRDKYNADPNFIKEFKKWVHEDKFNEALDVRDLPAIISNEDAFSKFKKGNLAGAKQVLILANPSLVSNLYSVLDQATRELRGIPLSELEDLRAGNKVKVQKLVDLHAALLNAAKHVGLKF